MMGSEILFLVSSLFIYHESNERFIMLKLFPTMKTNVKILIYHPSVLSNLIMSVCFPWVLLAMHANWLSVQLSFKRFANINVFYYEIHRSFIFQRRPVLVYIHNDESLFKKKFCETMFYSTVIIDYLNMNYVVWPWDITSESNRHT